MPTSRVSHIYRIVIVVTLSLTAIHVFDRLSTYSGSTDLGCRQAPQNSHVHTFDELASLTFERSLEMAHPTGVSGKWQKTSGGLQDSARMLLAEIYGKANSAFEYGLGESTNIAAYVGMQRYSGIDSDVQYVSECRSTAPGHFKFYFADVGETLAWGKPKMQLTKQAMQYQISPLLSELDAFDVYLIDGRWRIACACASLLHARKYSKNATILIHDYERTIYHVIEEVATLERLSSGKRKLAVLRRRPNVLDSQILELWRAHEDVETQDTQTR